MSFLTAMGRGAAFSASANSRNDTSAVRGGGAEWGSQPAESPYDQRNERRPPPRGAAEFASNRNASPPPPPLPPRGGGTRLINARPPPTSGFNNEARPQYQPDAAAAARFPPHHGTREQQVYGQPPPHQRQNRPTEVSPPLHTAFTRQQPSNDRVDRWNIDSAPPAARARAPQMMGYVSPPIEEQYNRVRPTPTQQSNAFQRHQYDNPPQSRPLQTVYDGHDHERIHQPPPPGLRLDQQPNFVHNSRQPDQYYQQEDRRQPPLSPYNQNVRGSVYEPPNGVRFEREPVQSRPQHDYRNTAAAPHDYRNPSAAPHDYRNPSAAPYDYRNPSAGQHDYRNPLPHPQDAPVERNNAAPEEARRDYQNYFNGPSQPRRQTPPIPNNDGYNRGREEPLNDENQDRNFNSRSSAATIRANSNNIVNDRVGYNGASNPRGGYHGSGRGGYSGFTSNRNGFNDAAANGGERNNRYDDRRTSDAPAYNGYRGFQQLDSHSTNRQRAQKGYVPRDRQIDDIFNEDSEDVNRHANTIFDGDADIEVLGESVPQRCEHWDDMNLNPQLLQNIHKSEYRKPRKIQQFVIPYMMDGFNIKCQSETGSGKSAAFLIPLIDNLIRNKEQHTLPTDGPICLIVSPTRELTQQLFDQAKKFANGTGISVSYAYGQVDTSKNLNDIRRGCNILCCCLGRLLDFVESSHITLKYVRYLVVDEADRLMDNKEDNYGILKLLNYPQLPKKEERQTCLFSATLKDPVVEQLADEYVDEYKRVFIIAKNESNARIQYVVMAVPSIPSKFRYLICYLKQIAQANNGLCPRVLVFVNRKINVDRVALDITGAGFPATTIHGDRGQDLREEALASFKSGKTKCLVATDVCARGVDIKDMDYVINYDLPENRTGFVQRCGRTGRSHNGVAVSFYCEAHDANMAQIIDTIIQDAGQVSPEFLRSGVRDSDYLYEEQREQQNYSRQEADPSPVDSGRYSHNASPYDAEEQQQQQIPDINAEDDWN